MIVLPAIDILGGRAVRLAQGRKDAVTDYGEPLERAALFAAEGAERLHVVDLDGAFDGAPRSRAAVIAVARALSIPVEVGGGIRDEVSAAAYLDAGLAYAILGTAAVRDPALVERLARRYPGQILVGIDARDGEVMVDGWVRGSGVRATDLAREMEERGAAGVIYTDIHRDGMLSGPNVAATAALAEALGVPVIASGGVSTLEHLRELRAASATPIFGAICGRSLYEGTFSLPDAIAVAR